MHFPSAGPVLDATGSEPAKTKEAAERSKSLKSVRPALLSMVLLKCLGSVSSNGATNPFTGRERLQPRRTSIATTTSRAWLEGIESTYVRDPYMETCLLRGLYEGCNTKACLSLQHTLKTYALHMKPEAKRVTCLIPSVRVIKALKQRC